MRFATLIGRVGLLLVAGMTAWSHPTAAETPASAARASVVADSGFRPSRDGYRFANYVNQAGRPNLGSGELRRLFGDAVCAGFQAGACVLSPPALAWMQQQNAGMAGGHCFGFSVSALLFWSQLSSPSPFGAATVRGLKIGGNPPLAREIAYGHTFQLLQSVTGAAVSDSPRAVIAALTSGLGRTGALYTLGVINAGGMGGHAVTPFAVERLAADRYAILVYDNNFPGRTRKVRVNTKTDTWSYNAATNPTAPASRYTGNADTDSLVLLPARPGLGVQPCAFCAPPNDDPFAAVPAGAPALGDRAPARAQAGPALQTIRLQTSGPVSAHLRITDVRGRRIGFVRGRLVNEIPGARVTPVLVGGARTWLERIEPQYEVPSGQRYRIRLTAGGRQAGRGSGTSATSKATVTVLQPGFVAAARRIAVVPGQRARLSLSADGHTLSFARPRGGRDPLLVLGNAAPGADDHQWNIRNRRRSTGKRVPVSLDVADRTMSFTGAGRYDLSMYKVGDGVSVFTHRRLRLGAGVTGILDYADWTDGRSMPLTEIKNGRVIRRRQLSDQASSDTGSQFIPTGATPAPAEPQPFPIAPVTPARPNTTIDRSPTQQSNSASASFEFSGTVGSGAASFECRLDGGSFASCTSPQTYDSLADGSHTFEVRAIDRAGNGDDTPARFSWLVDTTGPALAPTITPLPTHLGAAATATPNATDRGTGVASQSCAGVATSSVGEHTVRCTATDHAGNMSDVTVHYTVQYRILGLFPPAPNSHWQAGQTVPIKVALADAFGVRISDATAAALAADPCKVTFSASGAQTQSPTCMRYDGDQFSYNWKLGDAVGPVTLEIGVDYGTGTTTPLSDTITVTE